MNNLRPSNMARLLKYATGARQGLLGFLILSFVASAARGAPTQVAPPDTYNYCGVYAIYGASVLEGHPIKFTSLLTSRYIGCKRGSSMAELANAAGDNGFHTAILGEMSPTTLRSCQNPVVLYVRANLESSTYNHYILFQRMHNGKFVCLDNDRIRSFSQPQLMALWSGTGMIVSMDHISTPRVLSSSWVSLLSWLFAILAITIAVKYAASWLARNSIKWRWIVEARLFQIAAIVLFAIAAALVYNTTATDGLAAAGNQVRQLRDAHVGDFIQKISWREAHDMHASGKATFVDARFADDYSAGHIVGALSASIDSNNAALSAVVKSIPAGKPVLVYCEDKGCPFARVIASRLILLGCGNVKIYAGGWEDWHEHGK